MVVVYLGVGESVNGCLRVENGVDSKVTIVV